MDLDCVDSESEFELPENWSWKMIWEKQNKDIDELNLGPMCCWCVLWLSKIFLVWTLFQEPEQKQEQEHKPGQQAGSSNDKDSVLGLCFGQVNQNILVSSYPYSSNAQLSGSWTSLQDHSGMPRWDIGFGGSKNRTNLISLNQTLYINLYKNNFKFRSAAMTFHRPSSRWYAITSRCHSTAGTSCIWGAPRFRTMSTLDFKRVQMVGISSWKGLEDTWNKNVF